MYCLRTTVVEATKVIDLMPTQFTLPFLRLNMSSSTSTLVPATMMSRRAIRRLLGTLLPLLFNLLLLSPNTLTLERLAVLLGFAILALLEVGRRLRGIRVRVALLAFTVCCHGAVAWGHSVCSRHHARRLQGHSADHHVYALLPRSLPSYACP